MSGPSDASRYSDSTRGHPHSAPPSLPNVPTLFPAPSDGSPKTEEALVLPPSRSTFLVAADGDGNADAGAHSKKQQMGAESRPQLPNSGHVAPVKSSSSDSLKSQSDGSSSICSKGGDTSSSVSANEGLATSRKTPDLSQIPRIADQGREWFPENLGNKDNINRMQQQQQIGGNHRIVSYGGKRRVHTGGATGGGSHLGRYVNPGPRELGGHQWNAPHGFIRNPHMRMPPPPLHAQSQPFIPAPPPAAMPFYIIPPHGAPYPYYFAPPPPLGTPPKVPFIPLVPNQVPRLVSPATSQAPLDQQSIKLKEQIEYYFSIDNLCKDIFLRKNMDDQGWVPISLIATFRRVKQVTHSIPFILDALRGSTVVEIQGEKVRRRNDWEEWILPSTPEAKQIIQSLRK